VAFGEGGRGGARYGVVGRSGGKGVGQEGNMGGAALTWGSKNDIPVVWMRSPKACKFD